jgi:hypothetical protein
MIDTKSIFALANQIIDTLDLDALALQSICEELTTCTDERILEMTQSISKYYQNMAQHTQQTMSTFIRVENQITEDEEKIQFIDTFSLN